MNEIVELLRNDPYANYLGIVPEEVRRGYARCSVEVCENHLNYSGFPHGGFIFSLADVAFSGATASVHIPTTALIVTAHYYGTVKTGSILTAEAKLKSESRKFSYFDIEVRCEDTLIAAFNGTGYKISQKN